MKSNYLLTESLAGSIAVYMILKKLMTEFSDWDACKLGIIDKDGKKLKHPISAKEREAWDILTRFCWNIKKISMKFIGKSKFAQNFTAAYLLKDQITSFFIEKYKNKLDESVLDDMTYSKQSLIHNIIKKLPDVKCTDEDDLEMYIFKHLNEVEKILADSEINAIFEDSIGVAGSATSNGVDNLAPGPGAILGDRKKIDSNKFQKKSLTKPLKKDLSKIIKKKKRKTTDESN
jgi:hypothetical protein